MPTAPARLCVRCHQAVIGACPACTFVKHRRIDSQRGTSTERGYDAAWRVLRIRAFERDRWTCVECGWRPDLAAMYQAIGADELPASLAVMDELRRRQRAGLRHLQGDHIIPISQRPELRLTLGNIQTLCSLCHGRKTAAEDGGFGTSTRTNGNVYKF